MGASSNSNYEDYMDKEETKVANTVSYFTQISHYRDWLDSNMKDPQYCRDGAVTN